MDPVYYKSQELQMQRYTSNFELMTTNKDLIIRTYFGSFIFWALLCIIVKKVQDSMMESSIKRDPNSSWKHIKEMSSGKQYLHMSYVVSIIHAVTLMVMCVVGSFSCTPPDAFKSPKGTWLGDTCFTNDWCVDNGNKYEIIVVVFFTGYLSADFINCIFFIQDTSSAMVETYIHHGIGCIGTATALIVGRMILTLSNISCLTELSTPFIGLAAILRMHKKSDTLLYMVTGLTMTFSFTICRCVFQTWLVFFRLVPAVINRSEHMLVDTSELTKASMWFSLCLYVSLVFLNFFWCFKMVSGCLKHLGKDKK